MSARIEKAYPIIGSLGVAAVVGLLFPATKVPSDLGNVFSGALNIGAIAVGFLATAKSILISMEGRRVVAQLRRTGHYAVIVGYLVDATRGAFLLAVYSIVGLVVQPPSIGWGGWFLVAGVALLAFTGLTSYRVIDIFAEVLRAPDKRE